MKPWRRDISSLPSGKSLPLTISGVSLCYSILGGIIPAVKMAGMFIMHGDVLTLRRYKRRPVWASHWIPLVIDAMIFASLVLVRPLPKDSAQGREMTICKDDKKRRSYRNSPPTPEKNNNNFC